MKKLSKSVSTILCASVLCSSVMCYSALAVSANLVTQVNSTASVKSSNVEELKIGALDTNDYVCITEGTAYFTAKQDGYYSIVRNYNGYYCVDPTVTTDIEYPRFDKPEDAVKFFDKVESGTALTHMYAIDKEVFYIAYSKNGTDIDTWLRVTPAKDKDFIQEAECTIKGTADVLVESDTKSSVRFNATTIDGNYFTDISLYEKNKDGEFVYYDSISDYLGETSITFNYEFTQNGEYKVKLSSLDGSYYNFDVSVTNIKDVAEVEEDLTPPEIKVVSNTDIKGLDFDEVYTIRVITDEVCDIQVGSTATRNTKEASAEVLTNGEYKIIATDMSGNTSEKTVKVTAFGDGSMPEEYVENEHKNENPLKLSNKNTYWEDAVDSMGGLTELPQTGTPFWKFIICGLSAITASLGVLIAVKTSRRTKKKEEDK